MGKIQAQLGRVPTAKRWAKSRSETSGQSNRMLAGMQRQGGARRYSRVKRAVENRKKRDREMFRFCRFSGIGCGKGCLSCGVIQKGRFCPCGEWRGDGLLASRSELRFDRTVPTHLRCQTLGFSSKILIIQKAKCFANYFTGRKNLASVFYFVSCFPLSLNWCIAL